jgi:hypothetical protein
MKLRKKSHEKEWHATWYMYQRTLELLDNDRFGGWEIHLLSERKPWRDRESEAKGFYKKSPRAQKRVQDVTANDLQVGLWSKNECHASLSYSLPLFLELGVGSA